MWRLKPVIPVTQESEAGHHLQCLLALESALVQACPGYLSEMVSQGKKQESRWVFHYTCHSVFSHYIKKCTQGEGAGKMAQ